ncbi:MULTISPECIES: hypothetical protein [Lactobacillus]|uniref:hypothetical protein n=1 Tax=Lactobacillus TaxID=1578 RepID=UPI00249095A3|nr:MULTISPECIES: hypothetical protein [Lactobacillus]
MSSLQFQKHQKEEIKKFLKKIKQQKRVKKTKKNIFINKEYVSELQRRMNIVFNKENTDYKKRQAFMQYQSLTQNNLKL